MLPRRLTPHGLPYSAMEILSRLRIASSDEATLVESYLYAALDRIHDICERSVTYGQYELVLSGLPSGIDDNVGPVPFTQNYYVDRPGYVDRGASRTADFLSVRTPAIMLEMPPVLPNGMVFSYYDEDNMSQTLTTYNLEVDEPALLYSDVDVLWPETYPSRRDAVTVTFWAGETDELSWNESDTFTTLSGYPYANGDRIQLRCSGNQNKFLGEKAAVPTGFTNNAQYYVVEASGSTFKLSLTSGGSAITGTPPGTGFGVDKLFAGRLNGNTECGVMKIAIESFNNRCGEGDCSAPANDDGFMMDPVLRRMFWRPVMYT